MRAYAGICWLLALGLGMNSLAAWDGTVIYGPDGRQEVYELTDPAHIAAAASTVGLFSKKEFQLQSDGSYLLRTLSYGKTNKLCRGERFFDQGTAGFCSGSLIAPDVVLTAGHCVPANSDCKNTVLAFNFSIKARGAQAPERFPASSVYFCKELKTGLGEDFALVYLDRRVEGFAPLAVDTSGRSLERRDRIFVSGHPMGLPVKVAVDAEVRNVGRNRYRANLDTFAGNSGSAVFSQDGRVQGILVSGEADLEKRPGESCYREKQCKDNGCRGEDVVSVRAALPYLH